jgi:hypothetical protein
MGFEVLISKICVVMIVERRWGMSWTSRRWKIRALNLTRKYR